MTTATPRPKPMAPKKPLTAVPETTINIPYGTITREDLKELRAAMYGITPMEIHGDPVIIEEVAEKPKFIVKPHLTERPLKGHEGLMALRQQLESETPKRSGQSRTHKEKK